MHPYAEAFAMVLSTIAYTSYAGESYLIFCLTTSSYIWRADVVVSASPHVQCYQIACSFSLK